jgi:hypothetical protein
MQKLAPYLRIKNIQCRYSASTAFYKLPIPANVPRSFMFETTERRLDGEKDECRVDKDKKIKKILRII